jgi:hypothetical protein
MINQKDAKIIRELAKKVSEIAALPVMEERKILWKKHNSLKGVRPMILVFPEGAWRELLPSSSLKCEDEKAREIEFDLRRKIYQHENINDDFPLENTWYVSKIINNAPCIWGPRFDLGLESKHKPSTQSTGSWGFDPVINNAEDFKKLKLPSIEYDEALTIKNFEETQELLGDILDVKLTGIKHMSFHFMSMYIHLRGLEQMMFDLYDEPQMVHEVMTFFEQAYNKIITDCLSQNLFSLNNDDSYHSSGGICYSSELPKADYNPKHIRTIDLWASAESQEMAQVSPEMHQEFVMQYESRLLSKFGLNGYGCCEDLTRKLDYVFKIPNMRRISISPWADVDKCAEKLGNKYIFSWKPHPAHLVGEFNPLQIRDYIKHTLDVTKDCNIEMILKDTHTCDSHPERFTKWVEIARELIS